MRYIFLHIKEFSYSVFNSIADEILKTIASVFRVSKKNYYNTDIAIGLNSNITSILVITGEATEEDLFRGEFKSSYIFPSMKEIWQLIK
ncbi:MAG: hypothetical protein H6Q69_1200 [Firmicutes bacterium]|nr:hypothetical protein [Bacillota bacterium]